MSADPVVITVSTEWKAVPIGAMVAIPQYALVVILMADGSIDLVVGRDVQAGPANGQYVAVRFSKITLSERKL